MSEYDTAVAQLYQKLQKNDKNQLNKLHKINNSYKIKQSKLHSNQFIQQYSHDKIQNGLYGKNRQNWKKYLKDKIGQTIISNYNQKVLKNKITNKQVKYFQQHQKIIQNKLKQQLNPQLLPHNKNTQKQQIQSRQKPKKKFHKNLSQKDKPSIQNQKYLNIIPSQKNFRIRFQSYNHQKYLQQFSQLNQSQISLQQSICQLHHNTKQSIFKIINKYQIKSLDDKFLQLKQLKQPNTVNDTSSQKYHIIGIKFKSTSVKTEQTNIQQISKQLQTLNTLLQQQKKQIQKKQSKINSLPLSIAIHSPTDIFQQQQSQQQLQQLQQLPINPQKKPNHSSTYQNLMTSKRRKDWGLHQRFNYQHDNKNIQNNSQPNQLINISQKDQEINNHHNEENTKIVVNQKIKQYLFS